MNASTLNPQPTTDSEFADARLLQWLHKNPAMAAMVVMVCRLALERGAQGEFSANDLPLHTASGHGGRGIAGSVMKDLANAEWGVLAPVGTFSNGDFIQKHVRNAGGNLIRVWRLNNAARAQRLVDIHSKQRDARLSQAELLPA